MRGDGSHVARDRLRYPRLHSLRRRSPLAGITHLQGTLLLPFHAVKLPSAHRRLPPALSQVSVTAEALAVAASLRNSGIDATLALRPMRLHPLQVLLPRRCAAVRWTISARMSSRGWRQSGRSTVVRMPSSPGVSSCKAASASSRKPHPQRAIAVSRHHTTERRGSPQA